jgi:hypothetical protein
MMVWFTAWKSSPQWVRTMIFGGLFLLVIAGLVISFSGWIGGVRDKATIQGKIQEREAATGIVIRNVEAAQDAKQEIETEIITGHGDNLYAQCVRSARTPENCKRFLSDQ